MRDEEIDPSETPQIDPRVFEKMEIRMPKPKEPVSIRIDPNVLAWFCGQDKRHQTRINALLHSYVEAHSH